MIFEVYKLYCEYYNKTNRGNFNPYLKLYEDGSGGIYYMNHAYYDSAVGRSVEQGVVSWNDLNDAVSVLTELCKV